MSFYVKESGSYYYKDDRGNLLFMSDEISVFYDSADGGVLLKHGRPELVHAKLKKYQRYLNSGISLFFDFKVVTSNKWNVDELNKIIAHSNYVKYLDTDPQRFEEKA